MGHGGAGMGPRGGLGLGRAARRWRRRRCTRPTVAATLCFPSGLLLASTGTATRAFVPSLFLSHSPPLASRAPPPPSSCARSLAPVLSHSCHRLPRSLSLSPPRKCRACFCCRRRGPRRLSFLRCLRLPYLIIVAVVISVSALRLGFPVRFSISARAAASRRGNCDALQCRGDLDGWRVSVFLVFWLWSSK